MVRGVHFKGPTEDFSKLRLLWSENCVKRIVQIIKVEGEVEFYVDHGEHLQMELQPREEEVGDNNRGGGVVDVQIVSIAPPMIDLNVEAQDEEDVAASMIGGLGGPINVNGEESFDGPNGDLGPNLVEESDEEDPDFLLPEDYEEDDEESVNGSLVATDPKTIEVSQRDREDYLRWWKEREK